MKKFSDSIIVSGIALTFIIAAMLFHHYTYKDNNTTIDIQRFQHVLHEKEKKLNETLRQLAWQLKQQPSTDFFETESDLMEQKKFFTDKKTLIKEGFSIYIYKNDTLRYWTDNNVSVSNIYSDSIFGKKALLLNNAWYVAHTIKMGDRTLLGMLLIKYNYPYENDFLTNNFQPDFELSSSVRVSPFPLSYSSDISDYEGNYLFSLVPRNVILPDVPQNIFTESLYFIGIALLFVALHLLLRVLRQRFSLWKITLINVLLLVALRYVMITFELPTSLYELSIFRPEYFAQSQWFPSLGDFILNTFVVFFAAVNIAVRQRSQQALALRDEKRISVKIGLTLGAIVLMSISFSVVQYLFDGLIFNSNIPFEVHKVLDLNRFSFAGFVIMVLLFGSLMLITDSIVVFFRHFANLRLALFVILFAWTIGITTAHFFGIEFKLLPWIFYLAIVISIVLLRFSGLQYHYYSLSWFALLTSLYLVVFISDSLREKQRGIEQLLVKKLVTERDPIAEHLLADVETKMNNDKILVINLKNELLGDDYNAKFIRNYLEKTYFLGYWSKYELEVFVCGNGGLFAPENSIENCDKYFSDQITDYGVPLTGSTYQFMDSQSGRISYLGKIHFEYTSDSSQVSLYIKLDSKQMTEALGYPELLLDRKAARGSMLAEYSYAKYRNGRLINKSGAFQYKLNNKHFKTADEYTFTQSDGYEHLIYNFDANNSIVLSKPSMKNIDYLISFAYVFVLLSIIMSLSLLLYNVSVMRKMWRFNFRLRIQTAMVTVLLLSFLLVGGGTVLYDIQKYQDKHYQQISERVQSALMELEHKFENEDTLRKTWYSIDYNNLNELMIKLSQVFFSDINLYNSDGTLMATSRPEIFEQGLTGDKMHPDAYRELTANKSPQYIHDENIGLMSYSSAYVPVRNAKGSVLGYINLPYFTKPGLLRREISNLIVAVVNLYVVLFVITIVVAVVLSRRITQPLQLLQNRFRQIELGKTHEPIVYQGDDEIGSLVKEYNRMVMELAESIDKLARSERETAWREMAKQIAHEIKNPLTPMKLSIQFLKRSWQNNDSNFPERLEKVTNTLTQQIETLSSIATEFSNFAKMPRAKNEFMDLTQVLNNISGLFENNIEQARVMLHLNGHDNIKIFADKEQMERVFINLVKNGLQALRDGVEGRIDVELQASTDKILVSVTDNGTGIPEHLRDRLFQPNFTTKSSGMGLGLAIIKNIVENAGGRIWFETVVDEGTSFFVELPVVTENVAALPIAANNNE